jgi:hypothetical protein
MLRYRPTPAPPSSLRAPIRWPCWARGAGRVPAGIAVLCPTGLPMAADLAVAVGGWPASQASTAAIASVCSWSRRRPASPPSSCTSMVNPSGPGRGRRGRLRPWLAAASRAAGVALGGLGWGMDGSLLANGCWRRRPSSTAAFHGWGSGGSVAPNPDRVSITLIRAFAHPRAPDAADERAAPTTSQRRGRQAALHVQRHRGPANPPSGSRHDHVAAPGRPAQPGQHMLAGTTRRPPWWQRIRFDHWPITDRSRGQRLVHPSITCHWAAPQPPG